MSDLNDLAFKLEKTVDQIERIADKELQAKVGMTFSQFKLLMSLNQKDTMCQRNIAEFLNLTPAAVSRQVELGIEKGYLVSEVNETNRRANVMKLTDLGKKQIKKAYLTLEIALEEVFAPLDERERKAMEEGLHKILKIICPQEESCSQP